MLRLRDGLPIFAVLACLNASASGAQPAGGKAPAALEQVRKDFAAAVAARDRAAVAKLARFPVALEVYGLPPKLTEREFLHNGDRFAGIFYDGEPEMVKCLKTLPFAYEAKKTEFGAGLWYLDCNGNEYYFGKSGGKWAFAAYQNINE